LVYVINMGELCGLTAVHSSMSGSRTSRPFLVLIVEDDDLVRMAAVEMLEDAGLTVIEAESADEAWRILKSCSDIDVLFTDIDMPGSMDGFALAGRVAECWPYIRLVLTSGRCHPTPGDVPDHGEFICKPYRLDQVLEAVDRAAPR
jgi:CheY-like chemotaxis protein